MLDALVHFIKDVFKKIIFLIRSVLVWTVSLFLLLILAGMIFGSAFSGTTPKTEYFSETVLSGREGDSKVIIAPISGLILTEGSSDFLGSSTETITPKRIQTILRSAQDDPLVEAVVFDLNSPGGSPVASDRIFEMIRNFRRETGIPVVFAMGDMAASGGYYIASAADFIVANPATLTGSIGVIMETYNLQQLYEKIGVTKNIFKEGKYKDILDESREITEEERQIIQSLNENTYNLFISRVAAGRNLDEATVRGMATGQIFSGRQAKDLDLVDSLGNLDEAIYQAKSLAQLDSYQVVEYSSVSLFDELFGQITAPSAQDFVEALIYLPQTLYRQR